MPITDLPSSPSPASPPSADSPPETPSGQSPDQSQSPPAGPPQGPPLESLTKRRKRGDYSDMEQHELLVVIDELEDERSRLRRREGIWVSVLAHLVIFAVLAFLPRFLPKVRVVNPSDSILEHKRDLTVLRLPPDALKGLRQPPAPRSSVPAPRPAENPKAIQAPPAPKALPPAPSRQQAQQQPPPQQQPRPQFTPSQPLAPVPQSPVEAPRQAPTRPSFSTGPSTAGDAVKDAARAAARSGIPSGGGSIGAPGRGQAAGLQGGAQVLSDTGGWDYGPYIRRVVYDTKQAWYPIIPEEVRAPLLKKGVVGIRFKIYRDGSVHDMVLEAPSHDVALDKAAWGGITGGSPYPPLPPEFKGPYLELRFGFFYNQDPGLQ